MVQGCGPLRPAAALHQRHEPGAGAQPGLRPRNAHGPGQTQSLADDMLLAALRLHADALLCSQEDAVGAWPALEKWTRKNLERHYGQAEVMAGAIPCERRISLLPARVLCQDCSKFSLPRLSSCCPGAVTAMMIPSSQSD